VEGWKKEIGWGSAEERERLERLGKDIRRENVQRRMRREAECDEA